MPEIDFEQIRQQVQSGNYQINVHAAKRLRNRHLRLADIENAIIHDTIIERK